MNRTQSEIFKNSTQIAEGKIRQARAMQSQETKGMVKHVFKALFAKSYLTSKRSMKDAEA